jgi:hypothetical protein
MLPFLVEHTTLLCNIYIQIEAVFVVTEFGGDVSHRSNLDVQCIS